MALGRSTTSVEDHLIIWRTGLDGDPGAVPSISSPSLTAIASTAPTLRIKCVSDKCPVFVAVPGGEVLIDRDLTKNEDLTYFDKELDVVLTDASTVDVYENGKKRAKGKEGRFNLSRLPVQPPSADSSVVKGRSARGWKICWRSPQVLKPARLPGDKQSACDCPS